MTQNNYFKLSTLLSEYYRTRIDRPLAMTSGSGNSLEAIRRFSNINASLPYLKQTMIEQTVSLRKWWSVFNEKKPTDYCSQELNNNAKQSVIDFQSWCLKGGKR